jgi:N-acetylmuramoyl-L-alanine amidase
MQRFVNLIVIHCSATPEGREVTAADIDRMHRERKPPFAQIGYHFVVRLGGLIERGRDPSLPGAHVSGHNAHSIGICYIGGVDKAGRVKDTRTPPQLIALEQLVRDQLKLYSGAKVCGHRDLSPDTNKDGKISPFEWIKGCPSFDVAAWLQLIGLGQHALCVPAHS